MIEELEGFELSKKGTAFYVSLSETSSKGDVYAFARNLIAKAGSKGLDIGDLSNQIHLSYPSFSPKSFGYSQFQKFVSSIPGTVLHTEGTIKKVVMEEN